MFRSVAPWAASSPRERRRRCASTVKPPIPTRAMSSMPDGGQGEHDRLRVQHVARRRRVRRGHVPPDVAQRHAVRVEQDSDLARRGDLARDDEGELVQQALRVLHDAGDPAGRAAGAPEVTDPETEGGRHPAGHRHLARAGRVVPADQGEHRLAVRAARVLRAQVEGVDRAGDGDGLVLDHVDPAEAVPQRGDLAGQVRVGGLEVGLVLGGAETRVRRRGRVGGHRRPDDGGRHRDRDEPEDQQLLAPLTAQQPPGPADDRAPGGNAPVTRCSRRRGTFPQPRAS